MTNNQLIADLLPSTQYAIEVRAVRNDGVSEWSPRYLLTTVNDTVLPLAPVNVTWAVSGDSFAASWDTTSLNVNGEVINVVRYEVELTAASQTKILSVPQVTGSTVYFNLSYEDNRALFGSPQPTIGFRVRAVSNIDLKSAWTSILSASNPVPAAPTSVTATAGPNQIAVTWTPPADNDLIGYNIYIGGTLLTFVNATSWIFYTTGYVSTTLTVKAADKFNQLSTGANSNAVTPTSPAGVDTVAPPAPATVTATPGYDTGTASAYIDASWTSVSASDLSSYVIRYSTNGANWNYITIPAGTTSARFNVTPGTTYYVAVAARDYSANTSGFTNAGTYPVTSTADTTAPSQPAAPTVAANTLQLQVSHNGLKQGGGSMESDVAYYEVYASTTTGFTPSSSNMIGTMTSGPIILGTFDIPATGGGATQTWFVKVIAVDRSNNKSAASNQSSGNVALIAATNIVDATITNAKISDLSASKITAGTISAQTINIGATGVLNVDSTGIIKSNNYVANTTGYRLTNSSLEINSGSISAAALNIQVGNNIIPPLYASFEGVPSIYPTSFSDGAANTTSTISTAQKYINSQSLLITNTSGAARTWYLGSSATDYNIPVTPSTRYLISMYLYNASGSVVNGYFGLKQQNGVFVNASSVGFTNTAGWVRYTMAVTTTSAASAAVVTFNTTSNLTMYIDAVQVEPAINSTVITASPWSAPGSTVIDGGLIRTGSIQSTQLGLEWDITTQTYVSGTQPSWSIDTNGSASFANVNVLGAITVGDPGDSTNAGRYIIGSAFYVPGQTGWLMRGDGWAEFNQIVAESITGDAIKAGTLSADRLTGGSLGASIAVVGDGGFDIYPTGAVVGVDNPIITLSPSVGLLIDPPGEGRINVPSNGDPIRFENVSLSATDAQFSGNVSLSGTNNYISGDLLLENGISDPTVLPVPSSGWSDPSTYFQTTPPSGYLTFGLTEDTTGNYWVTPIGASASKFAQIWKIDKTTGVYSRVVSNITRTDDVSGGGLSGSVTRGPDLIRGLGKIVVTGTTYYATLVHYAAQSGTTNGGGTTPGGGHIVGTISYSLPAVWQVKLWNVAGPLIGGPYAGAYPDVAWTWIPSGVSNPSLTSDGTYIYIAAAANTSPYNFTVTRYAYNGTGATVVASSTGGGVNTSMGGIYVGSAVRTADSVSDLGGTRYLLSGSQNLIWSLTGIATTNDTATSFNKANNEMIGGLHWDGTQFRSITNNGKIYKYSTYTGPDSSNTYKYAWFDSDPNPTSDPIPAINGTHESIPSPPANYTHLRRGWTKVSFPQPQDGGNNNDPDTVRIYINDKRQADVTPGTTSVLYGTYSTSGTAPRTDSQFALLPQSGIIYSKASDTAGPLILLSGDGSGRVGPYLWDDTGELPAIFCYRSNAGSIASSTSTLISMNNTVYSSGGMTLAANGYVQVPYDGWYQVHVNITFVASTAANRRIVGIAATSDAAYPSFSALTGSQLAAAASSGSTTNQSGLSSSAVVHLNAGEYVAPWANAFATSWALEVSQPYNCTISVSFTGHS